MEAEKPRGETLDTWVTCQSCQLKHRRRPEGTCPRCANAVDAAPADFSSPLPAAEASTGALPADAAGVTYAPDTQEAGPGLRLAGGILLRNALLVLAERVMLPQSGGGFPGGAGIVSVIIDAGLGVSMLSGSERYRGFATVRAALGLLVFTGLHLYQRNLVAAGVQLAFSGALLMLLLGTPSVLRRGLAVAGVGLYLLLSGVGLHALRTGNDVLGLVSDAQVVEGGLLEGKNFAFRMTLPNESWRVRSEEAAARENPLVDRWIVHPASGVNLIVIGEEVPPGTRVNMDAFGQNVINNLRKGAKIYEVQSPVCANHNGMPTCLIRGSGSANMMAIEYEVRLFSTPGVAYQLVAFGPTDDISAIREELRQVTLSFNVD